MSPRPPLADHPGGAGAAPSAVARLFREYRDREFVFVEPGGNEGDRLIYMGAEKLARKVGISFVAMDHETFMVAAVDPRTVIYLHGSGGFNPLYDGLPLQEVAKCARHPGVVIQGPATFWEDSGYMQGALQPLFQQLRCERMVVIAREKTSFALLERLEMGTAELALDHDTSLHLTADDLLANDVRCDPRYVLYSMRTDSEMSDSGPLPLFSVWLDPAWQRETIETWLAIHAGARAIITNRLHSAMCGVILGIPTTVLPNSYFKNRAVWEYSLARRGVLWADRIEPDAWTRTLGRIPGVTSIMHSDLMRRLVWKAQHLRI